jgi:hypothetical protein
MQVFSFSPGSPFSGSGSDSGKPATRLSYFFVIMSYFSLQKNMLMIFLHHQTILGGTVMARGRKKYTLEEQYDLTVKQISETESVLKEFKAKKKELEAQLKEKQLSELSSLIESTGLSIEEIKGLIKKEETE